MYIESLSIATLEQAIQLRDEVFPGVSNSSDGQSLVASLYLDEYAQWFSNSGITQLNYWVAIDEESFQVIGLTGLYCKSEDEQEANWLGWFCVASRFRGKGIGKELLDFTIDLAQAKLKRYLRLYTWEHSSSYVARMLYLKRGFYQIGESLNNSGFKTIYLELQLDSIIHNG
ncbi:MAG: GNAT family N-acetyltransferase [Nostoc sp. DedQUE04]|uniref:GNAT family N-acetyltransferase n=1 Tax=Nostoc sp. DedQUE04 TaxID=3075390 RepID=UPI002AD223B3|nr:GNAT family N-acetyltransferase [Nostoc sp. DedQUE04]MDZ8134817.1 GNAT family N-acetyltransferase [Nostoc sp. DedQUE04]